MTGNEGQEGVSKMKDQSNKLSKISIGLHWIIAISMISLLAVGIYMKENEVWSLYPIHKSVGVILFSLILFRIYWRIKNGWPKQVDSMKPRDKTLSRGAHWILMIGMALMPIAGMIMGSFPFSVG